MENKGQAMEQTPQPRNSSPLLDYFNILLKIFTTFAHCYRLTGTECLTGLNSQLLCIQNISQPRVEVCSSREGETGLCIEGKKFHAYLYGCHITLITDHKHLSVKVVQYTNPNIIKNATLGTDSGLL